MHIIIRIPLGYSVSQTYNTTRSQMVTKNKVILRTVVAAFVEGSLTLKKKSNLKQLRLQSL